MKEIRTLTANEIECRVGTINSKGCSLLLYKDARVDMRLLDEVFGPMNWKRTHEVIDGNLYCTISVWDESKKEWCSKQDVGTESNTEKEKGQASDSFKRAGFNWGIGRELYTAPFIWIKFGEGELENKNGRPSTKTQFYVDSIGYNDHKEINSLVIKDNNHVVRYTLGLTTQKAKSVEQKPAPKAVEPKREDNDSMAELKEMAYSDISRVKTLDELMMVFNNYTSLQKDKDFLNMCTAKKTALKNGL